MQPPLPIWQNEVNEWVPFRFVFIAQNLSNMKWYKYENKNVDNNDVNTSPTAAEN